MNTLSESNILRAKGDYLLSKAQAMEEQLALLRKKIKLLEYEAFAHYARAEALDIAARNCVETTPLGL